MRATALLMLAFALVLCGQEEGPPRLKRGAPKPTDNRGEASAEQKPVPDTEPAPPLARVVVSDENGSVVSERNTPPPPASGPSTRSAAPVDDTIEQARRVSYEFQEKIPNFLCDQITFRHQGEGWPKPVWKLQDRISAELMFNNALPEKREVLLALNPLAKVVLNPPRAT